jgi:hypothetical protein
MQHLLNEGITAKDIAEPLLSFDDEKDAIAARNFMRRRRLRLIGIRKGGCVAGYAFSKDIKEGRLGDHLRPFQEDNVVLSDSSLAEVIGVLDRTDPCFVSILGRPGAVITRSDIQKPPVRMWLFGMVTTIEMYIVRTIEERHPDEGWRGMLTEGRLKKAEETQVERRRRGQTASLLDCLQLSDKARILTRDPEMRDDFGFESAKAGKRAVKGLESLRNNLAHSQDIVTHDWPAISFIASRVDRILTRI